MAQTLSFLSESWFWTGFFTVAASLGAVWLKESYTIKGQRKIERIRIYDKEVFEAHVKLYSFACGAENWLFPPEDVRHDFIVIMKNDFIKNVKPNMLLYSRKARAILQLFEAQYDCLRNPDLQPSVPFEKFIGDDIYEHLAELKSYVEERTDQLLHK